MMTVDPRDLPEFSSLLEFLHGVTQLSAHLFPPSLSQSPEHGTNTKAGGAAVPKIQLKTLISWKHSLPGFYVFYVTASFSLPLLFVLSI